MELFLKLPWNIRETEDGSPCCSVDDISLKKYSSTYRILHGNLQQIFSDDSSSDSDDAGSRKKARNEGSDTPQQQLKAKNDGQICKKPNMRTGYGKGQYVPCYSDETKTKYPKKSSLNAEQQAVYLQLMVKYARKHSPFPSPMEQKELEQYGVLHDKVVAERFEFTHFVKQQCALSQDRHLLINPDASKFIEEVWQHRLSKVARYPADYEPLQLLPLVYSDTRRPVIMKMEEDLLEIGSFPFIHLPKFKGPVHVTTDYSSMRHSFPPESVATRNTYKVPVSEDENAERFAVANGVHVVISSSGLKHITDNHPNFERTWDLPVIVKEHAKCDDETVKVVYVDKALPPRSLTTVEKNLWFHKFGVKSLLYPRRGPKCFQLRSNGPAAKYSKLINSKEGSVCNTERQLLCDTEETAQADCPRSEADVSANTCKGKHSSRECESDVSTDAEDRLVIDSGENTSIPTEGGVKNVPLKSSQKSDVESIRITRSKARLLAKMSYVNQSLCQKATQSHRECDLDNTFFCEDTPRTTNNIDLGKSLENVTSLGYSGTKENTSCSEVTNKMSEDIIVPEDHTTTTSVRTQYERCAVDADKKEKQKKEAGLTGFTPPGPGFNVSYKVWKLSKDEGHTGDWKEGFLKGDNSNREIKVLVRCKVDGCEIKDKKIQRYCVVPKLEYQTEYGAQCLTRSELTRQWISLYVRPGADLYRVRVNACTSEVMMIEQQSLHEVAQQAGHPNSTAFGTLYSLLLGLVDLEPGAYLLSHTPKLGAFANLRQSVGHGRFKLHDMYKIDPKATSVIEGSLWIPIDHNVVTPFHRACDRVPGTFPPTLFIRGKPVSKKKKKKRKKNNKRRNRSCQNKDTAGTALSD
ncbi:little elongation complex subunit 2 isoform X2 [Cryptotermes secundus]|uniref:little elongation complex subunit 2 isoform X2 n=1 Tax=Cryptotermes secundus TaxID=105785 RepID=UPI000CD7B64E|nr:little elongation complex subunit 2 isoform X2 [Cryptotermes secundus]